MENIATKQYKCEICETELKNHNGLRQHFKNVHNFVKEHKCNICQKVFKLNHQLTSHVKISHDKPKGSFQKDSLPKGSHQMATYLKAPTKRLP